MPPRRIYFSHYLDQPRPFPLAPPPPPSAEHPPASLAPDAHSQPIYCDAPRQRCTSFRCSHSTWTRNHPEFVLQRQFQESANIACYTFIPERIRGKAAGLIQFEGFFRPLRANRYKQVAPSGYHKIPETFGIEVFDYLLCLCAFDPSVPTCGARARVIDRTADGQGWWLACHRVPKVVAGRLDYTNTCGMFTKIHYYRKDSPAVNAEEVPRFAIRPPKSSAVKKRRKSDAAPESMKASTSTRRHSVAGPSTAKAAVVDLTASDDD